MLGSANISGSKADALHDRQPVATRSSTTCSRTCRATGTPRSPRRCKDLFERYGLTYSPAPLPKQVASAWHKVFRLSLPNGWLAETTPKNAPAQLVKLVRMTTGGPKVRREARQPEQGPRPARPSEPGRASERGRPVRPRTRAVLGLTG